MRGKLLRFLERLTIFLAGFAVIYFVSIEIFPWLNQRLPLLFTLFIAYLLTAYVTLPICIHLFRMFWKPMHIPAFTYSPDGWKVDPVNIGLVATEKELRAAMKAAGWHEAQKDTLRNRIKMVGAVVFRRSYPTAPMGTHILFGRHQDYGFQIPIGVSPHRRHHVRFWACIPVAHPGIKEHLDFWQARHNKKMIGRKLLWVGAATTDIGLAIKKRNLQIDHNIAQSADDERDFIIESLKRVGKIKEVTTVRSHEPYYSRHQTFMTRLIADGNIKICELRQK